MSEGGWANKLSPKTQNRFIVDSFGLAGLYRLVWGKWLTDQMWDRYISKNHHISDVSLVDAVMLQHTVSTNNEIKTAYL